MKHAICTILTASTLLAASACATATANLPRGEIYSFESDGNGFNTKTFFYDTGEEVVAIDAQFTPALARQAIAFLRTKTSRPLTHLVITHPNPDKFNGAEVFREEGAEVIASRRTVEAMPGVHAYKKNFFVNVAKMFREEEYPALARVDRVFDGELALTLRNGRRLELRELSQAGVSGNQTVAYVPELSALFVGDMVHAKAHAWLEGGIVNGAPAPALAGWIAGLREIGSIFAGKEEGVTVYGGRGEAAPLKAAISEQIRYLERADTLVSTYVQNLGSGARAKLSGAEAGRHYLALQARFEQEFPGYGLAYMIQYGVYGLVNSKL